MTAPDFATGDLGRVLDGLEALADSALTEGLAAHQHAAALVASSPRYTLERLCAALPGITDARLAAAWLVEVARVVLVLAADVRCVSPVVAGLIRRWWYPVS